MAVDRPCARDRVDCGGASGGCERRRTCRGRRCGQVPAGARRAGASRAARRGDRVGAGDAQRRERAAGRVRGASSRRRLARTTCSSCSAAARRRSAGWPAAGRWSSGSMTRSCSIRPRRRSCCTWQTGGACFMLATVRTGEPCPDAIVSLWKDGGAERLELAQLGERETAQLVESIVGGPVEEGCAPVGVGDEPGQPAVRARADAWRARRRGAGRGQRAVADAEASTAQRIADRG